MCDLCELFRHVSNGVTGVTCLQPDQRDWTAHLEARSTRPVAGGASEDVRHGTARAHASDVPPTYHPRQLGSWSSSSVEGDFLSLTRCGDAEMAPVNRDQTDTNEWTRRAQRRRARQSYRLLRAAAHKAGRRRYPGSVNRGRLHQRVDKSTDDRDAVLQAPAGRCPR